MSILGSLEVVQFTTVFVLKIEFYFVGVVSALVWQCMSWGTQYYAKCPRKFYAREEGFGKTFGYYDQISAKSAWICIKFYSNFAKHCSKKWLRINSNVQDVLTCLNRNLKTHLVGYLGKWLKLTLNN